MVIVLIAVALAAGIGIGYFAARRARESTAPTPLPPARAEGEPAQATDTEAPGATPVPVDAEAPDEAAPPQPSSAAAFADLLANLHEPYESSRTPQDVTSLPDFERAVAMLAAHDVPLARVVEHALGGPSEAAMVGAHALARRSDSGAATEEVVQGLRDVRVWTLDGLLAFLAVRAARPVLWDVLLRTRDWWVDNGVMPGLFARFIDARVAAGDALDPVPVIAAHPVAAIGEARAMLRRIGTPAAHRLLAEIERWERTRVDVAMLSQVGRVWSADGAAASDGSVPFVVADAAQAATLETLATCIASAPPRSVVLVGEAGTGKTTLVRRLAADLARAGWRVFEASAAEVLAGQVYIGELEKRVRDLLAGLDIERRVVWYVPAFHELAAAGRHRYSATSVLDMVLPAIEAGRLLVIGESTPAAIERVLQNKPRLRFAATVVPLAAFSEAQTRALAVRMLDEDPEWRAMETEPRLADDALDIARAYLTNTALPGSAVDLLRQTRQRAQAGGESRIGRDALLATAGSITGLPREVLDERAGLDPIALARHFERRVMGQPEAVRCLVERVAMLKAGLTDPRRPIGVFLFAGPTGTGKTEVAKTLAGFLFGDAERMVRVDMSELQHPGAVGRLLGEAGDEPGRVESLVDRVRKQPFSVVLLDEFEKAHPSVWDLFLQVFDDGRLTDAAGRTADFRHTIIILTSNVGATAHRAKSLGFTTADGAFNAEQVRRAIAELFRPEFVNRIDRIVVFNALTRAAMRDILKKELADLLGRRGFRNRDWAVEWEPSAIEFLLDRGFTPDMGARPLRRAIEEHVLAPLAMTIVEHRFPHGDQFLFVRSDGDAIQVEFIDPDAPPVPDVPAPAEPGAAEESADRAAGLSLGRIVLAARGEDDERRFLVACARSLEARLLGETWLAEKAALLARMSAAGFWEAAERFVTLDRLERVDGLVAALDGVQSLVRRLESGRNVAPAAVAGLAQQLHLLEAGVADLEAHRPGDAFLLVEPIAFEGRAAAVPDWPERIAGMYRAWARRRGLRLIEIGMNARGPNVYGVSGAGALALLLDENGLHVLETPTSDGGFERSAARVRVVGQPVHPPPRGRDPREIALDLLARTAASAVVRRYREAPSPLVRDTVRGWRTGRARDVLDGAFDLFDAPH